MKKRKKPIRKIPLEVYSGNLIIMDDYPIIDYKSITEIKLEKQDGYRIIFDACILEKVILNQNKFLRSEFLDCTFINCDMSNNTFTESTFIRCEFIGCKFTGCHFVKTYLKDILFKDCNLQYLDLAENNINMLDIEDSNMRESNWFENKVEGMMFDHNNLTETTLYHTPLKGLDISTCIIDEIRTDKDSIQGVLIDTSQAQVFCHLLGIIVK